MCYQLPIETLLLAFFSSKNPPTSLPLRLLQDTAQEIIKKVEYSILIDKDREAVEHAVCNNREFLRMPDYTIEKFNNNFNELLSIKTRFSRKLVPDFVLTAMDEAVSSAIFALTMAQNSGTTSPAMLSLFSKKKVPAPIPSEKLPDLAILLFTQKSRSAVFQLGFKREVTTESQQDLYKWARRHFADYLITYSAIEDHVCAFSVSQNNPPSPVPWWVIIPSHFHVTDSEGNIDHIRTLKNLGDFFDKMLVTAPLL